MPRGFSVLIQNKSINNAFRSEAHVTFNSPKLAEEDPFTSRINQNKYRYRCSSEKTNKPQSSESTSKQAGRMKTIAFQSAPIIQRPPLTQLNLNVNSAKAGAPANEFYPLVDPYRLHCCKQRSTEKFMDSIGSTRPHLSFVRGPFLALSNTTILVGYEL
jgi:hypothetical protein